MAVGVISLSACTHWLVLVIKGLGITRTVRTVTWSWAAGKMRKSHTVSQGKFVFHTLSENRL